MLQVVKLIADLKHRHRLTQPAMTDLLALLKLLLPASSLPGTVYKFSQAIRRALNEALGREGWQTIHMCGNDQCQHLYTSDSETVCPNGACKQPRYIVQQNGKLKPRRELRYLGLRTGLRVLLMCKHVCSGLHDFDLAGMVDSHHSFYSSQLSEQFCYMFIPGYQEMSGPCRRKAKIRFYASGQVCSDQVWEQHQCDIQQGHDTSTRLLVVEGGCDAFQPFKRRVWSTWLFGYRLVAINPLTASKGVFEIVTAIAEGKSEGKAAHLVAALDAKELRELAPPLATERPGDGAIP